MRITQGHNRVYTRACEERKQKEEDRGRSGRETQKDKRAKGQIMYITWCWHRQKCKVNCISRQSTQAVVTWQAPARPQVESYRSKEPINQSIYLSASPIQAFIQASSSPLYRYKVRRDMPGCGVDHLT
jgi:hypothetical protein